MFAILGFRLLHVTASALSCVQEATDFKKHCLKNTLFSCTIQTAVDRLSHLSGCLHQTCRESSQRCQTQAAFTGCLLGNNENINEQSLKDFWEPVHCVHVQYIFPQSFQRDVVFPIRGRTMMTSNMIQNLRGQAGKYEKFSEIKQFTDGRLLFNFQDEKVDSSSLVLINRTAAVIRGQSMCVNWREILNHRAQITQHKPNIPNRKDLF